MWWTKGPSADEMTRLRAVLGFNDVKVLAHGRGDGAIVIAVTEGLVVSIVYALFTTVIRVQW